MVITPNSKFILLRCPLKLGETNQITFADATAQYNYFFGLTKLEFSKFSYVRKDNVVRIPTHIAENDGLPTFEEIITMNYCMYQNTAYSNKWFYGYVTDVNYVSDGMTEVSIETDPFQSWQFDIEYKPSFIEREHVSDDTVGANTVPENVEHGPYIINVSGDVETDLDSCWICIGVSWIPENTPWSTQYREFGKVFSGINYVLFKFTESASKFVQAYGDIGRIDSIVNIFLIPTTLSGVSISDQRWSTGNLGNQTNINFCPLPNQIYTTLRNNISLTSQSTIDGYTPKNNKLFCYPYNFLSITNNCGTQTDYHYEDFVGNSPNFYLVGTVTPSCSIMLFPSNYLKYNTTASAGYNYGIPVGKYPQGSWNADQYTNWLTQNGVNILGHRIDAGTSQAIMGTAQALIGGATRQYESVGEGFGNMFGAVQEMYRHSMMSNTVEGQINSGDIQCAYSKMSPTYYKMSIKAEYARIVDNWFSMYGYKVNRLATPNIHKRSNWDYIKTINVNLEGNIPEKDMNALIRMFDRGCTFWHNTSKFLDYSQTNSILS